jgi:hypothetical protein
VQLSFRSKLFLIVGTAAASLLVMILVSMVLRVRQVASVDELERHLVPKLELGPKLETDFERLARSVQDAVAAQDHDALSRTTAEKDAFIAEIGKASAIIDAADAGSLRHAVAGYHALAHDVARRMIRGESGESLTDDIAEMQRRQRATAALIQRVARLDRHELGRGFGVIRETSARAHEYRIAIAIASLCLVLLLSF